MKDDRPNWRDPQMPVIRDYLMPNGTKYVFVDPGYERRYREHLLRTTAQPKPADDPTYNLRRRK